MKSHHDLWALRERPAENDLSMRKCIVEDCWEGLVPFYQTQPEVRHVG